MTYFSLPQPNPEVSPEIAEQIEIAVKYAGYIDRQEQEIGKFKSMEEKQIPDWLDYGTVPSLRKEARSKLQQIRPRTLGQASRISGVSPADVSIVMVWMKRGPQPVMPEAEVLPELPQDPGTCSTVPGLESHDSH